MDAESEASSGGPEVHAIRAKTTANNTATMSRLRSMVSDPQAKTADRAKVERAEVKVKESGISSTATL
jgi:hypothetical protein